MARPAISPLQAHEGNVNGLPGLVEFLNRLQQLVFAPLAFLFDLPLNRGQNLVKNVALTTSATTINHGLGRPVEGYSVVRRSATETVRDSGVGGSTSMSLTASGPVTVDLLFF